MFHFSRFLEIFKFSTDARRTEIAGYSLIESSSTRLKNPCKPSRPPVVPVAQNWHRRSHRDRDRLKVRPSRAPRRTPISRRPSKQLRRPRKNHGFDGINRGRQPSRNGHLREVFKQFENVFVFTDFIPTSVLSPFHFVISLILIYIQRDT